MNLYEVFNRDELIRAGLPASAWETADSGYSAVRTSPNLDLPHLLNVSHAFDLCFLYASAARNPGKPVSWPPGLGAVGLVPAVVTKERKDGYGED